MWINQSSVVACWGHRPVEADTKPPWSDSHLSTGGQNNCAAAIHFTFIQIQGRTFSPTSFTFPNDMTNAVDWAFQLPIPAPSTVGHRGRRIFKAPSAENRELSNVPSFKLQVGQIIAFTYFPYCQELPMSNLCPHLTSFLPQPSSSTK